MSTDEAPENVDLPLAKEPDIDTSDAEELGRHRDPSLTTPATKKTERKPGRGVVWMRPSDLLPQAGSRLAGRGIDFQAELARRARRLSAQPAARCRHAISERTHRLSPLSAFGNRRTAQAPAGRSGIGAR
jgi:hypothetical protein